MRKVTIAFMCAAVSLIFLAQTAEARTQASVSIGTPGFYFEASNARHCYPHQTWVECRHDRYCGHRVYAPSHWAYAPGHHRYVPAHRRHHDRYDRHDRGRDRNDGPRGDRDGRRN